jgi:DNA-binding CsgD family transcriptional regulator
VSNAFSKSNINLLTTVYQSVTSSKVSVNLSKNVNTIKANNSTVAPKKAATINTAKESSILNNEEFSYNNTKRLSFTNGILLGFLLMLLLLNVTCYFLFGENLFLFLGAYITSFIGLFWIYDLVYSSYLSALEIYTLKSSLLVLFGGISMLVSYHFLSFNKYVKSIKTPSILSILIALSCVVIGYYFNNQILLTLANSITVIMILTHFLIGSYFFNKKNYIKFFVLSSFIPILFFIDYFALQPLHIYFLGVTTNHIEIAVILQILILSYAIIYKMNEVTEEVEIKKTEMKIFLKQQDSLTRSNVEKLVEDVYLENLIMHYDLDGLEVKLLQYISEGKSNEKIARKLKLTAAEVKEYTQSLYEKLEIEQKVHEDQTLLDTQPDYIYN